MPADRSVARSRSVRGAAHSGAVGGCRGGRFPYLACRVGGRGPRERGGGVASAGNGRAMGSGPYRTLAAEEVHHGRRAVVRDRGGGGAVARVRALAWNTASFRVFETKLSAGLISGVTGIRGVPPNRLSRNNATSEASSAAVMYLTTRAIRPWMHVGTFHRQKHKHR